MIAFAARTALCVVMLIAAAAVLPIVLTLGILWLGDRFFGLLEPRTQ